MVIRVIYMKHQQRSACPFQHLKLSTQCSHLNGQKKKEATNYAVSFCTMQPNLEMNKSMFKYTMSFHYPQTWPNEFDKLAHRMYAITYLIVFRCFSQLSHIPCEADSC